MRARIILLAAQGGSNKSIALWSTRQMAQKTGLADRDCAYLASIRTADASGGDFEFPKDAQFVEKVRDMNPPNRAMVLCVDEKSQVQALDRTQPILRWRLACLPVSPMTTNDKA